MDGIFGIGLPELFMIAVIALIVLGPERLPGTIREVAKFIRQVRAIGGDLMGQFGDEFKDLQDLDPRRIINEMTDPKKPDPTKPAAPKPPAKAPTPIPAKNTTATTSTAAVKAASATNNSIAPKPATPATADTTSTNGATTNGASEKKSAVQNNGAEKAEIAQTIVAGQASNEKTIESSTPVANTIAPLSVKPDAKPSMEAPAVVVSMSEAKANDTIVASIESTESAPKPKRTRKAKVKTESVTMVQPEEEQMDESAN